MDRELRQTVLRRAAEIAGGSSQLRCRLGVEQHALELWLLGRATTPQWVFLLAVDLVLRDDVARAAQDRRVGPRAKARIDNRVPDLPVLTGDSSTDPT